MTDERNTLENPRDKSSSNELQERVQSVETLLVEIREHVARVRASLDKIRQYLNRSERRGP